MDVKQLPLFSSNAPKGKKGAPYTEALKKVLEARAINLALIYEENGDVRQKNIRVDSGEGKNFYDAIAAVQVVKALRGDTRTVKEIIDRVQGRVPVKLDMDNSEENTKNKVGIKGKIIEF